MLITEELKAVSWCDGDLSQIDNIINDTYLKIYKENNIGTNKKNAARPATEQAADLAKVFKIMPALEKKVTVSNIPYPLIGINFRDYSPQKIVIYILY